MSPESPAVARSPSSTDGEAENALESFESRLAEGLSKNLKDAAGCFPGPLCDRCLGRLLGRMEPRSEPKEKGALIRRHTDLPSPADPQDCAWCEGLFMETDHFAKIATSALQGYGFRTFLIATRMHPDVTDCEQQAHQTLEQSGIDSFEPLKMELNRAVGAQVSTLLDPSIAVDLVRPDAIAQIDPYYDEVTVSTSNIYLYGRYRKLDRTIPQTRWPCRSCKGTGCKRCDGTGQQYVDSVESLVSKVPVETFGAQDSSFHGAGREDIDALMLGTGRPFVLELKQPRWRGPQDADGKALDLQELEKRINEHGGGRVQVLELRWSEKKEVAQVKNAPTDKAYRAHVVAETEIEHNALLEAVAKVSGTEIDQRTPQRVAHRRADKIRRRRVHEVSVVSFGEHAAPGGSVAPDEEGPGQSAAKATRFSLDIKAASGTYIKELVSGDEGRTNPSFSGLLGVPMKVEALDVVAVDAP